MKALTAILILCLLAGCAETRRVPNWASGNGGIFDDANKNGGDAGS